MRTKNRKQTALAIFAIILLVAAVAYALTPEGTIIGNAATATYTDEDNNPYTTTSNIVQTVVLGICAVDLLVDQTAIDAAPDQDVYVPVEIKNSSNMTRSFNISTADVTLAYAKAIYLDANQNGVVDPGESTVAGPQELNMGETGYYIVEVSVPVGAADGDTHTFTVTVTDTADAGCTETTPNIDINVVHDALIVINKQVDYTVSYPGEVLTYTVNFTNIGTQWARSVDGYNINAIADVEGILVYDYLPTDTIFVAASASGQPSNGYIVYSADAAIPPAVPGSWDPDLADVGGAAAVTWIGFFIPDANSSDNTLEDVLDVDQQGSFTYEVTIDDPFNDAGGVTDPDQDEASRVDNYATVDYNDQTDAVTNTRDSNWVHTIVPSSATADISLGGLDSNGVKWSFVGGEWTIANVAPTYEEDVAAQTGTGNDGDYEDDNYATNVPAGSWVTFLHQVRNNDDNNDDVISLSFDNALPNLPGGSIVEFWNADGTIRLIDGDADGRVDLGTVTALGTKDFQVKVFIPSDAPASTADGTVDYYVDITAHSKNNDAETDLSRDNIDGIVSPGVDIAERTDAGDNANNDAADDNTDGTNDGDDILEADLLQPDVVPGTSKYYSIQLVNTGDSPNTYSLSAAFTGAVTPAQDDTTFRFLMDPDCTLDVATDPDGEPNGDEYELVDTPLMGGTHLIAAANAGDVALTVENAASFRANDTIIVGLGGQPETYTVASVSGNVINLTGALASNAAAGDLVSESICLILALDTDADTDDGEYNIVVDAVSSLNPAISNDMDIFVRIAAVCAVSVTPDHSDQLAPGGTTTYTHTITNSGNSTYDTRIIITPPAGSILNYRILDSGGNEVGSRLYDVDNLAPGDSQTFFIKVFAPANTPVGTVEDLDITLYAFDVGTRPVAVADPDDAANYAGNVCSDISMDTTTIIEGFLLLEKSFLVEDAAGNRDHDGYDFANDRCYDDGDGVIDGVDANPDGIPGGADPADSAGPCDIITYQVRYTNIGDQNATNVVITDIIPDNTEYVAGSLYLDNNCDNHVDGGDTSYSDAAADDQAEVDNPGAPLQSTLVRFRVGTGANATNGGTVAPDETGCIMFQVRIK